MREVRHEFLTDEGHFKFLSGADIIRLSTQHPANSSPVLVSQIVLDLVLALTNATTFDEAFDVILDAALRVSPVDSGGVYLFEEKTGSLHLVRHRGLPKEFVDQVSIYDADTPEVRRIKEGQALFGAYADLAFESPEKRPPVDIRGVGVIPVLYNRWFVGALNVGSHSHDDIPAEAQETLRVIAVHIGGVLKRLKAEQDERRVQKNLRSLFQTAKEMLFVLDSEGGIIETNDAAALTLGYSPGELLGRNVLDLYPAERREEVLEVVSAMRACAISECAIPLVHRDGTLIPVETSVTVGVWDDREVLLGVCRDITRQVQMEGLLRQSQKMEAIGQFASGVAHGLNNFLAVILGFCELAKPRCKDNRELLSYLSKIDVAGHNAADLVKQIRGFGSYSAEPRAMVDFALLVDETMQMLHASVPQGMEIKRGDSVTGKFVYANAGQLQQVVMNLCANAIEAMEPNNGLLEISVEHIVIVTRQIQGKADIPPGDYLRLTVCDSGVGMDETTMARVFDPFFTTKELGQGTGLGLSIVHGIVRGHDGIVSVHSTPGKGSRFDVYLPVVPVGAPGDITQERSEKSVFGGPVRILLVDDEPMVLEVNREGLEQQGFDVSSFRDPRKALQEFSRDPGAYDVMVSDLLMPGMTGDELAKKVIAIRPGMPIILCSGRNNIVSEAEMRGMGVAAYLKKPFHIVNLAASVNKILEESLSSK